MTPYSWAKPGVKCAKRFNDPWLFNDGTPSPGPDFGEVCTVEWVGEDKRSGWILATLKEWPHQKFDIRALMPVDDTSHQVSEMREMMRRAAETRKVDA